MIAEEGGDDLGRCRGQEELETYLAVKAMMNESRW